MEPNSTSSSRRRWTGPLCVLGAGLCFSLGGLLCKSIPWSGLAINGVRSLFAAAVVGAYLKFRHHKLQFNLTVAAGAVSYMLVTTLFTMANKMTTAANAIILQYTAPVWIILMMLLFFGERPKKLQICTVAAVFAGILCFFYDSLSGGSPAGDIIAVLSGIFYAVLFIINRFEKGDQFSAIFFGQLLSGAMFGWLGLRETDYSPKVLGLVVLIGVVQVGVAYIFFGEGVPRTHPVTASLIGVVEPIMNPLLVAIVYGETLQPLSLVGAAIVLAAVVIYNVLSSRKEAGGNQIN